MIESAELGARVSKADYLARLPELRVRLLNAQHELRGADFSVMLLLAGDDRAGCNDMLNALHSWIDTRLLETHAMDAPTDEELERPEFWRYWRVLPGRGRIGIFLGAWTMRAVRDRLGKRLRKRGFERALERIRNFEQTLADDGTLVLKFWLHQPKRVLRRQLELARKRPDKAWWVKNVDHRIYRNYDRAMRTVERALRKTSTGQTPWHVVESTNVRHRNLTVGTTLLEALSRRLDAATRSPGVTPAPAPAALPDPGHRILDRVDLASRLAKPEYEKRRDRATARIHRRTDRARARGISSVLVFEGFDAAGKGSCIRRLGRAVDAQNLRVVQIGAPTEEERARHYLCRFWQRLPRAGRVVIFDRSWYGRVLVERVEKLAAEEAWRRAYSEINEFEEQLRERGMILLKFWLHVDAAEQLRRFDKRRETPFKKYKLTEEDLRNRARSPDYEAAANEMIARTSTEFAPWQLVPGNDKRWARVQVLETFARALKRALG